MNKTITFLLCMLLSIGALSAQKYGHLNSLNLLEQMPATKAADAELEKFSNDLLAQLESKIQAFQTRYQDAVSKIQNGTITPIEQQKMEQELQQEQQAIETFQKSVDLQVMSKRQELIDPITQKLQDAIQEVGKEGGYAMIFDESTGALLFTIESQDITAAVKAKLGI